MGHLKIKRRGNDKDAGRRSNQARSTADQRPDRIVCAEPSPGVAVALANSFGLSASILGQGSGNLTVAQSETLLQLAERTATIQFMRDQLYRACEAYANGPISGMTYSVIISRINDTMVTLNLKSEKWVPLGCTYIS